jgi:hypothetical protein
MYTTLPKRCNLIKAIHMISNSGVRMTLHQKNILGWSAHLPQRQDINSAV